jgi:hypothetical protein
MIVTSAAASWSNERSVFNLGLLRNHERADVFVFFIREERWQLKGREESDKYWGMAVLKLRRTRSKRNLIQGSKRWKQYLVILSQAFWSSNCGNSGDK